MLRVCFSVRVTGMMFLLVLLFRCLGLDMIVFWFIVWLGFVLMVSGLIWD